MNPLLHHFAYNIRPGKLEFVIELFNHLGCDMRFREGDRRWCMMGQDPINVNIQIIETPDKPVPIKKKISTHIAFLSKNPEKDVKRIQSWVQKKGYKFDKGAWTKKEHWFDIPEVFTNFVIEIMHTSVVE